MASMSTAVAASSSATFSGRNSAKAHLLEAPVRRPHYRRATTTRAPRKRTFIAVEMEKVHPLSVVQPGAGLSVVTSAAAVPEIMQLCHGNNGGNNGRYNGKGASFGANDDNNNSFGSAASTKPSMLIAVAAAVAMSAAFTVLPSPRAAMAATSPAPAQATASRAAAAAPPASLCLNNPRADEANKAKASNIQAIPYGQVDLTDRERRMLGRRQLHFNETVRVYC